MDVNLINFLFISEKIPSSQQKYSLQLILKTLEVKFFPPHRRCWDNIKANTQKMWKLKSKVPSFFTSLSHIHLCCFKCHKRMSDTKLIFVLFLKKNSLLSFLEKNKKFFLLLCFGGCKFLTIKTMIIKILELSKSM